MFVRWFYRFTSALVCLMAILALVAAAGGFGFLPEVQGLR